MGGISIWQLLIILLIVVLVFGSKKLSGLGKDLGGAVKGFKDELDTDKTKGDKAEDVKAVTDQSKQEADFDDVKTTQEKQKTE